MSNSDQQSAVIQFCSIKGSVIFALPHMALKRSDETFHRTAVG